MTPVMQLMEWPPMAPVQRPDRPLPVGVLRQSAAARGYKLVRIDTPPKRRRIRDIHDTAAMLRRMLKAYGQRVAYGDVADLQEMVELRAQLDDTIYQAVVRMREMGFTWEALAEANGTTKQALQQWAKRRQEARS